MTLLRWVMTTLRVLMAPYTVHYVTEQALVAAGGLSRAWWDSTWWRVISPRISRRGLSLQQRTLSGNSFHKDCKAQQHDDMIGDLPSSGAEAVTCEQAYPYPRMPRMQSSIHMRHNEITIQGNLTKIDPSIKGRKS